MKASVPLAVSCWAVTVYNVLPQIPGKCLSACGDNTQPVCWCRRQGGATVSWWHRRTKLARTPTNLRTHTAVCESAACVCEEGSVFSVVRQRVTFRRVLPRAEAANERAVMSRLNADKAPLPARQSCATGYNTSNFSVRRGWPGFNSIRFVELDLADCEFKTNHKQKNGIYSSINYVDHPSLDPFSF